MKDLYNSRNCIHNILVLAFYQYGNAADIMYSKGGLASNVRMPLG